MNRRHLITGVVALVTAPAVARASSLMPLRGDVYHIWEYSGPILPDIGPRWEAAYAAGVSFDEYAKPWLSPRGNIYRGIWTFFGKTHNIYSDERIDFRKEEIFHLPCPPAPLKPKE